MSDNEIVGRIRIDVESAKATTELKRLDKEIADISERRLRTTAEETRLLNQKLSQLRANRREVLGALDIEKKKQTEITADLQQQQRLHRSIADIQQRRAALAERAANAAEIEQQNLLQQAIVTKLADRTTAGGGVPTGGGSRAGRVLNAAQQLGTSLGIQPVADVANVAADFATAKSALSAVGVSAATMTTALIVAVPAAIALGLGVKDFSDRAVQGKASADAATSTLENYFDAIGNLTTQEAQDQLVLAKERQKNINAELAILKNARDEAFKQQSAANPVGDLGARIQGLFDGFRGADGQLASTNERIAALTKQATDATGEVGGLERALSEGALTANDLKEVEQRLADVRKAAINDQITLVRNRAETDARLLQMQQEGTKAELDARLGELNTRREIIKQQISALSGLPEQTDETNAAILALRRELEELTREDLILLNTIAPIVVARQNEIDILKKSETAINEAIKIREQAANLEEARAEQLAQRRIADSRAVQVASLEGQIAAAKAVEAEQERIEKVTKLRQAAVKEEAADRAKLNKRVNDVNGDFFKDQLKALADFRFNEQRISDDAARNRLRKLQDLETELSDLASAGDVVAFIRTQRDGLRDIQRDDEDTSIDAGRRLEDFRLEREQAVQARNEQLRDLLTSFEQERAVKQQGNAERINQEIAAGYQRLKQSEVLEQQLTELRERFAQEDLIRTRLREDQAFKEQMDAYKKRQSELAPVIAKGVDLFTAGTTRFLSGVSDGVISMINRIRGAVTGTRGQPATLNADGGIYMQPTYSMLGEKKGWGDVVIPFRQSEGIGAALDRVMNKAGGGGQPINVYVTQQVGDIATASMLRESQQQTIDGIKSAIVMSRGGAA